MNDTPTHQTATQALAALQNRLAMVNILCCGTASRQSIGELADAILNMPEWDVVHAALPSTPQDAQETATVAPDEREDNDTDREVIDAFNAFRSAVRKERGGVPAAMNFTPLEAFAAGMQAGRAQPQEITAAHVPPGWKVRRADVVPFRHISIEAPNGARARVSNVSRNPENLLYMLGDALLTVQAEEPVPDPAAAEERCARCHGGLQLANGKCPAGKDDCAAYPGWSGRAPAAAPKTTFQQRVEPWLIACFGQEVASDRHARNHPFFEEASELAQACGMTSTDAHQLVDYVWSRPVGVPHQEVGGVMVSLSALCLARCIDMNQSAEAELARIWTRVDEIRARQASKLKPGLLPAETPHA